MNITIVVLYCCFLVSSRKRLRSMSPSPVTLLPYTPAAHLLYHHCCCCCNCCTDAAAYACPVYTCTCSCAAAVAVTSRPNISIHWNHPAPSPVFRYFSFRSAPDPPNSRLSRRDAFTGLILTQTPSLPISTLSGKNQAFFLGGEETGRPH